MWDFWLEADMGPGLIGEEGVGEGHASEGGAGATGASPAPLVVELHAVYLDRTPPLLSFIQHLEPWWAEVYLCTVYQSRYAF